MQAWPGTLMLMTPDQLLASHTSLTGEVQHAQESLKIALLTIDKLKVELAYLRRMKYGRSSEQMEHAQLELVGGMVVVPAAEPVSNVTAIDAGRKKRVAKPRPGLREFPEHLPRRTIVHTPPLGSTGCDCQACGRALREIGQDVSEVLDYEPGSFHVVRHVRPRLACSGCKTITQAAAPSRPVERGMAGPGLLAHVLVGKYADSLPLYRQCQIYAREGVMLERSTLTDWVGQAARLLTPLAQAIGRHVLRADKIHGDDTPIRVLGGKGSKAKTGRLWVYVRDDRPGAGQAPPSVWFQYSADRKGEHPARHLKDWRGILQADAFAGYNQLYEDGRIVEAACWSHYPERSFIWRLMRSICSATRRGGRSRGPHNSEASGVRHPTPHVRRMSAPWSLAPVNPSALNVRRRSGPSCGCGTPIEASASPASGNTCYGSRASAGTATSSTLLKRTN